MFPSAARKRDNCRVIPVVNPGTRIAIKGDDPDIIILEVMSTLFNGATVTLPNSAPIGKLFTFILAAHPQLNPSALLNEGVTINIPASRTAPGLVWLLCAGQESRFIYTPNGWLTPRGVPLGSDGGVTAGGVAIGSGASGGGTGIAVGYSSNGSSFGVAAGVSANGSSTGVAVGYLTAGTAGGTALGYRANTNSKDKAVALGYYSKAERYRELVKSADGAAICLQSFSILDWYGDTANATPVEILLGGTAAQYAVLLNSSAFMFRLSAIARNNVDDVNACWSLTGGIKRGANAAATALIGTVTKTIIGADAGAATWDIDGTADTTNGSLKLTVTGEASKTIRWNVRGDISELRF